MRNVLLLALALQFVSIKPPVTTPTVWLIADDRTASLTNATFKKLPDWDRKAILPMMQPGDTASLMFVDHVPRGTPDDPQTVVLDPRPRQFTAAVLEFDATVRRQQQASRSSQTDLGRLFRDLRQAIDVDRQTGIARTYVLAALTDGVPDGPQTEPAPPVRDVTGVDYRIVCVAVEDGTEKGLRDLAAHAGFAEKDRMLVVPHEVVDQSVAAIQRFVGRPVNAALAEALGRAAARTGQAK